MERFESIGVIKNQPNFDESKLDVFMDGLETLRKKVLGPKMISLSCILDCCLSLLIKRLENT